MATPEIRSYRFGHLVVDSQLYNQDVIILPGQVLGGWWREDGHAVHPGDLQVVLEAAPEVLIVGQGAYGRMLVTQEACQTLEDAGIELIAQPTHEACQSYNRLRLQRSVAAALHLTC